MKLNVFVKTGRKESKVIKNGFADYEIWVKTKPVKGAANKELIEVLSGYFGVKKSDLRIVRGLASPKKVLEIRS